MHMSSSPTKVKFLEKIGVKICTWTVLQLHRRHLHSFLNLQEPGDEWEGSNQISAEEILGVFRCSRQIRGSVIKMLGCSHHISGCSQQKFTKPVSIKQLHVTINQLSFCANGIICVYLQMYVHTLGVSLWYHLTKYIVHHVYTHLYIPRRSQEHVVMMHKLPPVVGGFTSKVKPVKLPAPAGAHRLAPAWWFPPQWSAFDCLKWILSVWLTLWLCQNSYWKWP